MLSVYEIKERISEDWQSNPNESVCLDILDYLLQHQNLIYLTISSLKKITDDIVQDEQILEVLQYLCGRRVHLLDMKFELIINDDDPIDIPSTELSYARSVGFLVHPYTGEQVIDFEKYVYIYFSPSETIKRISLT